MSKTKNEKETTVNSQPDIGGDSSLPTGFNAVTPQGEGNRAWFKCEVGAVCQGRLIGRFQRKDSKGAYYQIKLSQTCKAVQGKGDASKTIELEPGDIINVDERSAISSLQPYADSDGIFDVYIQALEKIKLDGGKTFWRMNAGEKQLKAPTHPITHYKQDPSQTDDMGAPF